MTCLETDSFSPCKPRYTTHQPEHCADFLLILFFVRIPLEERINGLNNVASWRFDRRFYKEPSFPYRSKKITIVQASINTLSLNLGPPLNDHYSHFFPGRNRAHIHSPANFSEGYKAAKNVQKHLSPVTQTARIYASVRCTTFLPRANSWALAFNQALLLPSFHLSMNHPSNNIEDSGAHLSYAVSSNLIST